jgi:phosphoenolpyruvate phosphomutase
LTTPPDLRQALGRDTPCRIVGTYDAITSRLVQAAGFEAVWVSGLCVAASQALPDANLLGLEAICGVARAIRDAVTIPVVVDGDSGYGDFHNVIHAVRALGRIGVDGISLEDKLFPKMNSFGASQAQVLAPPPEHAAKIRAAVDARPSDSLHVIARVEALIAGASMEEALGRAELYREAGADAVIIHSKRTSADEVLDFARRWHRRLPVIVIPTTYPDLTLAQARDAGIAGVIYANQPMRAALQAVQDYLAQLRASDRLTACRQPLMPIADVFHWQGMPAYLEDDGRYRNYRATWAAALQVSNGG